jgi:hypothetical protein
MTTQDEFHELCDHLYRSLTDLGLDKEQVSIVIEVILNPNKTVILVDR